MKKCVIFFIMVAILLGGCDVPLETLSPTSTPSATTQPSAIPTLTPSPTLTPEPTTPPGFRVNENGRLVDPQGGEVTDANGKPIEASSVITDENAWVTALNADGVPTGVVIPETGEVVPVRSQLKQVEDEATGKFNLTEVGPRFIATWPEYAEWNGIAWEAKTFPAERYAHTMFWEWFDNDKNLIVDANGNSVIPETVTFYGQTLNRSFDDERFKVAFVDGSGQVVLGLSERFRKLYVISEVGPYAWGIDVGFGFKLDMSQVTEADLRPIFQVLENEIRGTRLDKAIHFVGTDYRTVGYFSNSEEPGYVPPSSPFEMLPGRSDSGKPLYLHPLRSTDGFLYSFGDTLSASEFEGYVSASGMTNAQYILFSLLRSAVCDQRYPSAAFQKGNVTIREMVSELLMSLIMG